VSNEYPSSPNVHSILKNDSYDDSYYYYDYYDYSDDNFDYSDFYDGNDQKISTTTDGHLDVITKATGPENITIPYSETDCSSFVISSKRDYSSILFNKSSVSGVCVNRSVGIYQFLEWHNLLCDSIILHEINSLGIYYLNITQSRIQLLDIQTTYFKNLSHIHIQDSVIDIMNVSIKEFDSFETLSIVNCSIKHLIVNVFWEDCFSNQFMFMGTFTAFLSFEGEGLDILADALKDQFVFSTKNHIDQIETYFLRHYHASFENLYLTTQKTIYFESSNLASASPDQTRIFGEVNYLFMRYYNIHNISHFQDNVYESTISLDLAYNRIEIIRNRDFDRAILLHHLDLHNNFIYYIENNAFLQLGRLHILNISNNFITEIPQGCFSTLENLYYLLLNFNQIEFIHTNAFSNLRKLDTLDISYNKLESLKKDIFLDLRKLKRLYIQNNNILVQEGMFLGLSNLQELWVDVFSICCAKPNSISDVQCHAPPSDISSCEQLISNPSLNVVIWYIAFLATFGNVIALLSNLAFFKNQSFSSYSMFTCNLNISDMMMGLYLYIIAFVNLVYSGRYAFEDHSWRHSGLCSVAGVLATVSSESSSFFVTLITIDRILAIKYPMSPRRLTKVRDTLLAVLAWAISFTIAIVPILPIESLRFREFYAETAICMNLPLSVIRKPDWQYSMVVFVGFNSTLFLGILVGQLVILFEVIKCGRKIRSSNGHQREVALAKTVGAVVLTDFFCWIPIGIIGTFPRYLNFYIFFSY
jgi:hypothetical protein